MTESQRKKTKIALAIGIVTALGVGVNVVYGASFGRIPLIVSMSMAIGLAIGAAFDFAKNRK